MIKRIATKVLIFLLIVFVGDRLLGGIVERLFLNTGFRYSMLYQGQLPGDVVILGNSRGLHMFHPPSIESVAECKVGNLAFNALPTAAMPIIWEDYLVHHETPEMLVIEVSCIGSPEMEGAREQLSILIDQNSAYGEMIGEKNKRLYYASKVSRLFRYNTPLMLRSAMFLKKSDQAWIMDSQLNAEAMQQAIEESDATLTRSKERAAAIRRVLEISKAHNVKVKLVLAPFHPDYLKRLTDVEQWLDWAESELGQKIENHSALITNGDSFADNLHLHQAGAVALAEKLTAIGFFSEKKRRNVKEPDSD